VSGTSLDFVIAVAKLVVLWYKGQQQASNDEMFGWVAIGDVWVAFGQHGYSKKNVVKSR
jgi:hypothetical protein